MQGLPTTQGSTDPTILTHCGPAQVGNEVVASAWEQFVMLIVQEWVYDAFWGFLSPDTTFPAEIRQLLHDAFGNVAERAHRVDVNAVLGQIVRMLMVRALVLNLQLNLQGM